MARKKNSRQVISAEHKVEIFYFALALLPALFIAFGNPNTILDWYSSDDGFYYFQVARNLAAGQGFTFDGLNPTNGFHPLWLFLIAPIFVFAQIDVLLPLRVLMVVSALLSAGTAIFLCRILARFTSAWVAAVVGLLWIAVPRIHDLTLHAGVEAGLNAFCLLLFWHALAAFPQMAKINFRALIAVSGFGALAILARLDNIFVVGFGMLWLWWRLWSPPKKSKVSALRWRASVAVALAAPVGIVLTLYVAWNLAAFGTATPISGQVKLWWGTLRNTVYGFPVNGLADFAGQFVTDHPELGPWSLLTAPIYAAAEGALALLGLSVSVSARRIALLALGSALALAIGAWVWAQRNFLAISARGLGLLPFFVGCFVHIAYYKFSGSVAQQPWYWIAQMLLILLALGLLLEALLHALAARLPKRSRAFGPQLGVVILAVLAISYVGFISTAVRAPGDGSNHFYIHRARWLESNTEAGARIAITGAGNLAYFIEDRTIVNMDGLMNTADYLHSLEEGEGAAYLASLSVDYIFGNEYILTETNPYEPMLMGHLQPYGVYLFGEDRELPLWRFVP